MEYQPKKEEIPFYAQHESGWYFCDKKDGRRLAALEFVEFRRLYFIFAVKLLTEDEFVQESIFNPIKQDPYDLDLRYYLLNRKSDDTIDMLSFLTSRLEGTNLVTLSDRRRPKTVRRNKYEIFAWCLIMNGNLRALSIFCAAVAICVIAFMWRKSPKDPLMTQVNQMAHFGELCRQYRRVTGSWPINTSMISTVLGVTNQTELYDVWGHAYQFYPTTGGSSLLLTSYGADGKPGGDGENSDFTHNVK